MTFRPRFNFARGVKRCRYERHLLCSSFLIFPLALLILYWEYTYFDGHPIEQVIPSFGIFLGLAVLILLEATIPLRESACRRGGSCSETSRRLPSTCCITGTVATCALRAARRLLPGAALRPHLVLRLERRSSGPLWLQFILAMLLYEFLRYGIHRVQHIVPFLWELHSYHHSVTDLKASNTYRVAPDRLCAAKRPAADYPRPIVGFDPAAILFGVGLATAASLMSHCGAGLHAGWLNRILRDAARSIGGITPPTFRRGTNTR